MSPVVGALSLLLGSECLLVHIPPDPMYYFPVKLALRLEWNASTPSRKSSELRSRL